MSNLLNDKAALQQKTAIRFEKAFGISAKTMMRMQAAWNLAQVELRADGIKVERWPEAVRNGAKFRWLLIGILSTEQPGAHKTAYRPT